MSKHAEAVNAFHQGERQRALQLFEELLQGQQSSELWSDWATVQAALGNLGEAEAGLRRALQLDPQNHPAKADLGILMLSQGDLARGIPLIEECISWLPESQQPVLRAALESARRVRVLVVDDCLPKADAYLGMVVQALGELGHPATLVSRELSCADFHPCRHYSGDRERLAALGIEIEHQGWTLRQVLEEGNFDIAILTQNFNRGLSIPEHYLEAIRRHSPNTRIAILSELRHGAAAMARALASGGLCERELAEDWTQREEEAFRRADLVMVADAADAPAEIPVAAVAANHLKSHLPRALALAASLTAKPLPREAFSMTLVDVLYAQLLEQTSGPARIHGRLDGNVELAEQLLRHGRFVAARQQLRHIFGWLAGSVKLSPALAQPLGLLKRCYRHLGDQAMAARCGEEARRCFTTRPAAITRVPSVKREKDQPSISLIVPTYNRLPILKKCLAALEAQTVPKQEFEVIVIDDGSCDDTQAFLQEYKSDLRMKSLRQNNSGTGTARRHGVEHASGEYLLLMNDDTICNPSVIEEHLSAQRRYAAQKWAVLGNFEYPDEARRRAMTHFFRVNSFMFPQVDMEEGCPYGYSHFITCNLSIRRDAVEQVGSFDGTYMLSEDTEMGIKLFERGYSVVYHPAAHAWHDHAQYAVPNLIRRARIYGGDYFYMFRNHPRVMKEWVMPIKLTDMDAENGFRIRAYVDAHRQEVKAAVDALSRWDAIEFEPILANPQRAAHVLSLFQQSVPAVHWFHLFERMLEVMAVEFRIPELGEPLGLPATAK